MYLIFVAGFRMIRVVLSLKGITVRNGRVVFCQTK